VTDRDALRVLLEPTTVPAKSYVERAAEFKARGVPVPPGIRMLAVAEEARRS